METKVECMFCKGSGESGTRECYGCGGSGEYAGQPCEICYGTGWFTYECPHCEGSGYKIIELKEVDSEEG